MAHSTIWWLCTGAAVAVELVTGTFYLLMLGVGLAAAAVAAHLGASVVVQLLIAAVVGGGAVVGWHMRQLRRPASPTASAMRAICTGSPLRATDAPSMALSGIARDSSDGKPLTKKNQGGNLLNLAVPH